MLSVYSAMKWGMETSCVGSFELQASSGKSSVIGCRCGSNRKNGVDLARAGAAKRLGDDFGGFGIVRPTEQPQKHGGVMHLALPETVLGVIGHLGAELFPADRKSVV